MATQAAHKTWLRVAGFSIFAFGILGLFGTWPATNAPLRWSLDLLAWPLDGYPAYETREMYFLTALSGGFLAGWGATIFGAAHWLHDGAPEPVRKTVLTGLLVWFTVDSAGSIISGHWPNAIWNVAVLAFLAGPLGRPSQERR